jgi:Ser/Thr protein kinase RdoA (MazF antagonist)
MELPRPVVDATKAAQIAVDYFGIVGEARELPAEFDRNFLISAVDGPRYVLKVSHGERPPEDLEMQVAVLRFLAGTAVGARVPTVVSADSSEEMVRLPFSDGVEHWVRMLTYIDGQPLVGMTRIPPSLLAEIGRFLAELDNALVGFDHPGTKRDIQWDITRVLELAGSVSLIKDLNRRRLLEDHLEGYRRTVTPRLARLRRSVVHNDANDHNLLVTDLEGEIAGLCGLIDFGDMIHTVTVAEPAIAAAYLMLDSTSPWQTAAHVVQGYDAVRPLDSLEREVFPNLVVARLCASVLMSARAKKREPDNEYLRISEQPVWRRLESLEICDPSELFR